MVHSETMDVKEKELKKPASALKSHCGIDAASSKALEKQKGSKLSGKNKGTKTQGTAHSGVQMLPRNKPQQVSNTETRSKNQLRINKLLKWEANLKQQLIEVRKENRQLQTRHNRETVQLQRILEVETNYAETITKCKSEVHALQTLIHNASACRNRNAAKLKPMEAKLVEIDNTLKEMKQVSKDHDLEEREQLTRKLAKVTIDLEQKDKKIEQLERHIQLSQAWYNRQLASLNRS
ncbi:lebercilin-like protein isoform X2 [Paralichthys olivaceus]|uniref:lebercilin-like protein isoform X2 n=1 Tax=Paralichthys olivaceus TaxID=8255 RepID=UPI0037513C73